MLAVKYVTIQEVAKKSGKLVRFQRNEPKNFLMSVHRRGTE